jgi:hypothetical protein
MRSAWLPYAVLRAASLLAPQDQRASWLEEWQSELWYVPRRQATFCLGAFRDALWVRRNDLSPAGHATHLESAARCLAFLAALAALSLLISACLLGPLRMRSTHWQLGVRDLPSACLVMLLYTGLYLPVTRLVMGRAATGGGPPQGRLRRGLFLASKIALVQPILLCGTLLLILVSPVAGFVSPAAMCAMWVLTTRWLIVDQRRRCPVCLRSLTDPVRIGTPSQSFLAWYGAESMCSRGHGLLQAPEISTSYLGGPQWLRLDESWSSLFPRTGGARP